MPETPANTEALQEGFRSALRDVRPRVVRFVARAGQSAPNRLQTPCRVIPHAPRRGPVFIRDLRAMCTVACTCGRTYNAPHPARVLQQGGDVNWACAYCHAFDTLSIVEGSERNAPPRG